MSKRSAPQSFLDDYSPSGTFLAKPDPKHGRPGLLTGQSPDGRDVLIKMWPKPLGGPQDELLYIWRSEVRQLQRLAAIPGADELFVPMLASGQDEEGFYLVLDLRDGSPLERVRNSAQKTIVSQARLPRKRRILWMNALRVAQALDLLHAQGIIHRNIDPWAIVTTLGDQPDFRLTGFEWSMRIASMPGQHTAAKPVQSDALAASFSQDWRNLGLLICELVGAPAEKVADLNIAPSDIASHLSSNEGRVLRQMIGLDRIEHLDGQRICRDIEQVISAMDAEVAGKEMKSLLALRLGRESRVAEAIRAASDFEIEMSDTDAQLQFAKDDLAEEPFLALVRARSATDAEQRVLMGRRLTYVLLPYKKPDTTTAAEWEFAVCDRVLPARPPANALIGHTLIEPASLELHIHNAEAHKTFALRRGRVARWDDRTANLVPTERHMAETERKHQAFALLTLLEMAYATANIFPVEVLPGSTEKRGELHVLRLAARTDPRRAELSKALKIEAPAIRLVKMLEADDVAGDTGWTLVEIGSLGEQDNGTEWRFVQISEEQGQQIIQFEGPEDTTLRGPAFIAPTGLAGEIVQFRRRVKALRALSQHTELLKMLVDPRFRIDDSHDPIVDDDHFKALDSSKREALQEILSTVPLFLLQGPPGVGKTFMVADIVRRRFDDEPTTRLLMSAQSNAAIDHLMKEVQAVFTEANKPIMIRARPALDDAADTDLEIDKQASVQLQKLANSPLVGEADTKIAQKVQQLAQAARNKPNKGKRPMAAEARAFESMILRAANLVFATTNSAAIENLIEERGFFDWTIIEEAGKATGGELLSPLLLSHRRLMIGDHKQLPPYGADRLEKLLSDPASVRASVKAAGGLIERHLQDAAIEEIFDEVNEENADYGRLCSGALQILNLFASFVDTELAPRPGKSPRRPIARRLAEQHRMHPAIAKIVSACFYDGLLRTNDKKAAAYRTGQPPFVSTNAAVLPDKPIIFIDMPWCRETVGYAGGDRGPAWSNPDEATAIVQALSMLRGGRGESKPSLAVLSPYREQVKLVDRTIANVQSDLLPQLSDFTPAIGDDGYCGTVDSFQGDQADLVIVSMVRNNGHASPGKALGFLRDNRRMNVLLSRAKWRLIIVGCLRFYTSVSETAGSLQDSDVGFLAKFLAELKSAEAAGDAAIVPWAKLRGRQE